MSASKVLIIVLVAIVMLFVIAIALGARSSRPGPPDRPDPVAFLEGLKSDRFLLRDGDGADIGCPSGEGRIPVDPACTVVFPERGRLAKPIRIAFLASGPVRVRLQPADRAAEDVEVDPSRCYQSAVDAGGGTLTVSLAPAATGPVTLTLTDRPDDADGPCPQPED